MKKPLITILILLSITLTGCTKKDEYKEQYNPSAFDLREVLEETRNLDSAEFTITDHLNNKDPYTVQKDGDTYYDVAADKYYLYVSIGTFRILNQETNEWSNSEGHIGITGWNRFEFVVDNISTSVLIVFDVDNAIIKNDYYIVTSKHSENVKISIRINSLGQIDYYKYSAYIDGVETIEAEIEISKINSIDLGLPE
jgi:hypothetical protein